MTQQPETLGALLRRFADDHGDPAEVPSVSLSDAIQQGDDPLHLLPYLASLGMQVATLDDLLAINDDEAEEEVRTFRVAEGIAVTIASDGAWALFTP